jgi:DNA mismatch repair protein MutS2
MKCVHPHTYEKLGFDILLHWAAARCAGEDARTRLLGTMPSSDPEQVLLALRQTAEMKEAIQFGKGFSWSSLVSVSGLVSRLEKGGHWLNLEELWAFCGWMQAIIDLRASFPEAEGPFPLLHTLLHSQPFSDQPLKALLRLFDAQGNLRDDASPALLKIRREIQSASSELRNTLYRILRKAQEQGWAQDTEITIRNDRFVIPVKTDAKGRVPGFVHDVSQSGQTVFMEPADALPLNNRVRELHLSERNEVIRIMQEATDNLRPHLPQWLHFQEIAIQTDVLQARARLAIHIDGVLPDIRPEAKGIRVRNAKYPLLVLRAKEEKFEVTPLALQLDPRRRIILISGPNAGGKSVALKTVGLLQLMLQSGFLVPVAEDSEFRIFHSLFIDIGDEQSVANDLSTYTSHLFQMRQMGDQMTGDSLFLIDEFGSGTDPKLGGAIAEAFLERFLRVGAFGIITTHYGNLKDFAEVNAGIGNAAMEFDTQELKPTFRLLDGLPGRSYAFEMAQRVGVHPSILKRARTKLSTDDMDAEKLLGQLQEKQTRINRLLEESTAKEARLNRLTEENKAKKEELDRTRKELIRQAKAEAREILVRANKEVENAVRRIRESQAEKEVVKQVRETLAKATPEPQPEPVSVQKEETASALYQVLEEPIAEGDWVKWRKGDSYGRLVELQGKKAVVEIGELRLSAQIKDLVKIRLFKEPQPKVHVRMVSEGGGSGGKLELDVMGMRVEEALPAVDKWIDQARMIGFSRLRLLHGKGGGILREALRRHLMEYSFVEKVQDASPEEGGAGWTIIHMQ